MAHTSPNIPHNRNNIMPANTSSTLESFEAVASRLRVVASCDHCRSRKIKCTTQDGHSKCDACSRRKTDCTYNARSKYYNERERAIATHIGGGSGGVASVTSSLGGKSSIISFSPASSVPSAPSVSSSSHVQPPPIPDPSYPPVALMPYLIELFFKHYAASLPFMSYESVIAGYLQSTLSPVLSNSIACLASRYSSEMNELSALDPFTASEYYADQTKDLLRELSTSPSIDAIIGSTLVAFHEHVSDRVDGVIFYAQQSAHLAKFMGIYDDATVVSMSYSMEQYQHIILLRNSVSQLYQSAMSGRSIR